MILLMHIAIALLSIANTTYLFFAPTRKKLLANYGLIALTLGSGTYLVLSMRTNMLEVCTTGLLYLGVALGGTVAARHKVVQQAVHRRGVDS